MKTYEQNGKLILKEYGRNVQKLVDYILTVEDREKRTQYAHVLIHLMKQIHPTLRDSQDNQTSKLWDDLYIMSGFTLDVDSPYPMPEKQLLGKKPKRLGYNTHQLYYKHYGRNVELLIEKAKKIEGKEEREAAICYVGKLMKTFYTNWNKENVDDNIIVNHMKEMSKNALEVTLEKVKAEGWFDTNRNRGERKKPNTYQNNNTNNNLNKKRRDK